MTDLLRKMKLDPIPWEEAVHATGNPAAHTSTVIESGFKRAQAVVVLLTPDDIGCLNPKFPHLRNDHDQPWEREPTGQPRLNVVFEAGRASATHPNSTIFVEIGELRPFSDIAGQHTVRFDGTSAQRNVLASRLETAGCPVDRRDDWVTDSGEFSLDSP